MQSRDGKSHRERRVEERRSEKRKSQKKEDTGARKGRTVAKHCVFPMICGSGGRSQLARWEMKNCTPLWREAHFEVKMHKTPCSDHFGSSDVVSHGRSRDCAPSQKWVNREGFVAFPKTMAGVGHLKRICKDAFSVAGAVQETSSSELVRVVISWEGLHFGASDLEVCYFAWQVQHFVWHGITFSWQAQYFRQVDWKNRKTNWYEAVSSALNFPFWKEVSQNCFVFDVVKVQKWWRLAELLRVGCCQVQKLQKSRRLVSFLMLSTSKNEEVSQNCFVFDVVNLKKMRKSRRIAAFFWLSTLKNEEVSQNI